MHKAKQHPVVPVAAHATIASDGLRAFPILEAFNRLSVSYVKGYKLIKTGELQTLCIGRRRYATADAIKAFLERCIANSKEETAAQREKKVAAATSASLRSRAQRAAA